MFKRSNTGYIVAIGVVVAFIIGWIFLPASSNVVSLARDMVLIASVIVGGFVFYDWQRSNIDTRWWVWGITFWNKKGVLFSDAKLPAVVLHFVIVNPNIFTVIIDDMNLTISGDEDIKYRLSACAFADENSFKPRQRANEIPLLQVSSFFNPVVIKPRSEKECWVVFISRKTELGYKKLEEMLDPGIYKSKLELKTAKNSINPPRFNFNIDSSCIEDHSSGTCRIDYRDFVEISEHAVFQSILKKARG